MNRRTVIGMSAALAASRSEAGGLPEARPERVGLSRARLARVDETIDRYIQAKQLAGAVTLVARRGRVAHFASHGVMDLETRRPMSGNTLFRMASSTKPVIAVGILLLLEEGRLRLGDPLSRFLPEFRRMQVETGGTLGRSVRVAASREITLRDLLTHMSGLASGGSTSQQVTDLLATRGPRETLGEFSPRWATLPLEFHPGTQWRYSGIAGFDLLGRVIEIVASQTLDRFLQDRIFGPLGMTDTRFIVPEADRARQAAIYRRGANGLEKNPGIGWLDSSAYFCGAGGLISTAADYFRFAQALLDGRGRSRILSPRTVEVLRSNHVGTQFVGQLGRPAGMGFGLGGEVVVDRIAAGTSRSNGSWGWDGAFGTHFWLDPQEELVAVLMVQTGGRDLRADFETAVLQSVVE